MDRTCVATTVGPYAEHGEPLLINDARLHGSWGLAVTRNDGPGTRIYPFEALRRWHDGEAPYGPDSGDLRVIFRHVPLRNFRFAQTSRRRGAAAQAG